MPGQRKKQQLHQSTVPTVGGSLTHTSHAEIGVGSYGVGAGVGGNVNGGGVGKGVGAGDGAKVGCGVGGRVGHI